MIKRFKLKLTVAYLVCFSAFAMFMLVADEVKPEKKYPDVLVMRVIKVYDGDTITVDISGYPDIVGKKIGIRVNGIDTPEIRDPNPKIKRLAYIVRDYIRLKIKDAKRIELRNLDRGKYFRIVADVYVDGKDLKADLVKKGYAKPYDGGTKVLWTEEDADKAIDATGVK